jgi:DNA-binding XRE family transcriptional regulator
MVIRPIMSAKTDNNRYNVGYMPRNKRPVPAPIRRALQEVSENLAVWRKLRGLTQAQLADRAGVARDTIVRLEGGDGAVSTENLMRVLRALGILEELPRALDPYETDVGRLRSDENLPQRIRPRTLRTDG